MGKYRVTDDPFSPADALFDWARRPRSTGCMFAANIARLVKQGAWWNPITIPGRDFGRELTDRLNAGLRIAVTHRFDAIQFIFPDVVGEETVADLIAGLSADSGRWCCEEVEREGRPQELLFVSITCLLRDSKHVSSVLGVADLRTMPVTRRAPVTALLLRVGGPGSALEVMYKNKPNVLPKVAKAREALAEGPAKGRIPVNLGDIPPLLDSDGEVEHHGRVTRELKKNLLAGDPAAAAAHISVTFSLPAAMRPRLAAHLRR